MSNKVRVAAGGSELRFASTLEDMAPASLRLALEAALVVVDVAPNSGVERAEFGCESILGAPTTFCPGPALFKSFSLLEVNDA